MFSISHSTEKPPTVVPNLLPCIIKHNGPVPVSARHWAPTTTVTTTKAADGNETSTSATTAYFRGRKLRARALKVPEGYQGMVLQKTDQLHPREPAAPEPARIGLTDMDGDDEDASAKDDVAEPIEVKMMDQYAVFDEILLWGHEAVPDDEDAYVKGMEEWIAFAATMHDHDHKLNKGTSLGEDASMRR